MKDEKEKNDIVVNKEDAAEVGKFIRIGPEADEALSQLHEEVNRSGDFARITKVMVASYVLEKFCPMFSEDDCKALLMKNVSEVDLLRIAYKRAIDSGVIPDNLREILFSNAGLTPGAKKTKKGRLGNGIIATIEESEAS